jgi:hypothetical protein
MLHLIYTFRPTAAARADLPAFWRWVGERERWFYDGLDMAHAPRWYVCTVGPGVHTLEHWISFADEAGWGDYRREVSRRSANPAWEQRRIEQDRWWDLLDARLLNDAPLPTVRGDAKR